LLIFCFTIVRQKYKKLYKPAKIIKQVIGGKN
jgi:hypothetical protein